MTESSDIHSDYYLREGRTLEGDERILDNPPLKDPTLGEPLRKKAIKPPDKLVY
jgi:hypothetical protein